MIDVNTPNDVGFKSIFTYIPSRMISTDACPHMPYIMDMNPGEVSVVTALLSILFDQGSNLSHSCTQSIFDAILFQVNNGNKLSRSINLNKLNILTSDDDRWHQVVSYINLMYSNSLLDVVSVAQEVGISQRSLNYLFSQKGTTFSKILWDLRLSVVKDWLSDASMNEVPIKQIAADAGFKSAAHLSTFFKSHMSCSPREFRRRANRR